MPKGGFEPPQVAPYAPQAHVSTSSTTSAFKIPLKCIINHEGHKEKNELKCKVI